MQRSIAAKIMSSVGWLSRQPEDFRTEVLKRCLLRNHGPGKLLYDIDDEASGLFGLVDGLLEVHLPNGHLATIATPGFWVGEGAAFRRLPRRVALVARSPVWIYYLPLAEFENLIRNPDYCRYFAILTIEHLEDALRVVASLMPNEAVARISGRLLNLEAVKNISGRELNVTQSDLASMCGLTRPTVTKALRRLIDERAVSSAYGKLTVIDAGKLKMLSSNGD